MVNQLADRQIVAIRQFAAQFGVPSISRFILDHPGPSEVADDFSRSFLDYLSARLDDPPGVHSEALTPGATMLRDQVVEPPIPSSVSPVFISFNVDQIFI